MKNSLSSVLAIALASFSLANLASAEIETYSIDTSHSSVKFSIRHFVAKTTGNFAEFSGEIKVDRSDLTNSSVNAVIAIPSVDTDNGTRDEHLQEAEYFDAAQFPEMTFESTEWKSTDSENKFVVTGELSLRGIAKEVQLDVELLGFGDGMNGAYLSGWEITTLLDRTDFGVDGGQPAVGNEVDVTINIEAIRQ